MTKTRTSKRYTTSQLFCSWALVGLSVFGAGKTQAAGIEAPTSRKLIVQTVKSQTGGPKKLFVNAIGLNAQGEATENMLCMSSTLPNGQFSSAGNEFYEAAMKITNPVQLSDGRMVPPQLKHSSRYSRDVFATYNNRLVRLDAAESLAVKAAFIGMCTQIVDEALTHYKPSGPSKQEFPTAPLREGDATIHGVWMNTYGNEQNVMSLLPK